MYEKLIRLRKIDARYKEICKELDDADRPTLTNLDYLPMIRKICYKSASNDEYRTYKRDIFIAVVLALYCPHALCGGRIKSGVRMAITSCAKIADKTYPSHKLTQISFLLFNHKKFRAEVETAIKLIREKI